MENKDKAVKLHKDSTIIDGLNISKWGDEGVFRHIHQSGFTAINATNQRQRSPVDPTSGVSTQIVERPGTCRLFSKPYCWVDTKRLFTRRY